MDWPCLLNQAVGLGQVPQPRELLIHVLWRLTAGQGGYLPDLPGRHGLPIPISGHQTQCAGALGHGRHTSQSPDDPLGLFRDGQPHHFHGLLRDHGHGRALVIQHIQPEALSFILGGHHLPAPEGRLWLVHPPGQGTHHHHLFILQDVVQQIVVASSAPSDIAVAHFPRQPAPLYVQVSEAEYAELSAPDNGQPFLRRLAFEQCT